jgi:hypothetical protein
MLFCPVCNGHAVADKVFFYFGCRFHVCSAPKIWLCQ